MSYLHEDDENEVRRLTWELQILRDQVLKIAESLPAESREQISQISERMTASCEDLRTAITRKGSESDAEALERLRNGITAVRRELRLIAKDLHEVAFKLPPGEYRLSKAGQPN
jgi:septation ring formation regulator EzrA